MTDELRASTRHDAESPVGSLDVERLHKALGEGLLANDDGELVESLGEAAVRIAAEYARLTELEQDA